MDKLTAMAEERGFRPGPDETVADVVFLDGATTAEPASTTSGMGVGLSAVRELCRSLKGDAHLLANNQGGGSLLGEPNHAVKRVRLGRVDPLLI